MVFPYLCGVTLNAKDMETFIYKVGNVEKNVYKVLNELGELNDNLFATGPDCDKEIQKVCALLNRVLLAMKTQAAVLDSDLDNRSLNAAKNALLKAVLG